MFDRATYIQNRMVMPRNCRLLRPPANRRVEASVLPDPIMGASLAQVRAIAEPAADVRDEIVAGRDEFDAARQTRTASGESYRRVVKHTYQGECHEYFHHHPRCGAALQIRVADADGKFGLCLRRGHR